MPHAEPLFARFANGKSYPEGIPKMYHVIRMLTVITALSVAIGDVAVADPDNSFVRVAIEDEVSSVFISGRTRVDIAGAVFRGLEKRSIPAKEVTAGPWLRLPEESFVALDKRPHLTVCAGDSFEGSATTAYIAITPRFPFSILEAIASELKTRGFSDVRILSDDDPRSEFFPQLTTQELPASPGQIN